MEPSLGRGPKRLGWMPCSHADAEESCRVYKRFTGIAIASIVSLYTRSAKTILKQDASGRYPTSALLRAAQWLNANHIFVTNEIAQKLDLAVYHRRRASEYYAWRERGDGGRESTKTLRHKVFTLRLSTLARLLAPRSIPSHAMHDVQQAAAMALRTNVYSVLPLEVEVGLPPALSRLSPREMTDLFQTLDAIQRWVDSILYSQCQFLDGERSYIHHVWYQTAVLDKLPRLLRRNDLPSHDATLKEFADFVDSSTFQQEDWADRFGHVHDPADYQWCLGGRLQYLAEAATSIIDGFADDPSVLQRVLEHEQATSLTAAAMRKHHEVGGLRSLQQEPKGKNAFFFAVTIDLMSRAEIEGPSAGALMNRSSLAFVTEALESVDFVLQSTSVLTYLQSDVPEFQPYSGCAPELLDFTAGLCRHAEKAHENLAPGEVPNYLMQSDLARIFACLGEVSTRLANHSSQIVAGLYMYRFLGLLFPDVASSVPALDNIVDIWFDALFPGCTKRIGLDLYSLARSWFKVHHTALPEPLKPETVSAIRVYNGGCFQPRDVDAWRFAHPSWDRKNFKAAVNRSGVPVNQDAQSSGRNTQGVHSGPGRTGLEELIAGPTSLDEFGASMFQCDKLDVNMVSLFYCCARWNRHVSQAVLQRPQLRGRDFQQDIDGIRSTFPRQWEGYKHEDCHPYDTPRLLTTLFLHVLKGSSHRGSAKTPLHFVPSAGLEGIRDIWQKFWLVYSSKRLFWNEVSRRAS